MVNTVLKCTRSKSCSRAASEPTVYASSAPRETRVRARAGCDSTVLTSDILDARRSSGHVIAGKRP
jgi:hypothetical protein